MIFFNYSGSLSFIGVCFNIFYWDMTFCVMTQDLEDALGELKFSNGMPDVKFSRVSIMSMLVFLCFLCHLPRVNLLIINNNSSSLYICYLIFNFISFSFKSLS